jgi:hypothetical protein
MGYILKNTSGLINTRLTDTGRLKLSQGKFNISYFQVGDSEVSYNTLTGNTSYNQSNTNILEPNFNSQNSAPGQTNKQNVKYPYYVDGNGGNTYGIPYMESEVAPIYNRAAMRGFFSADTTTYPINWSALTDNEYVINSNYIVDISTLTGGRTIEIIYSACNTNSVREPAKGDIITLYIDGSEVCGTSSSSPSLTPTPTPTPSATYDACALPTPPSTPSPSCSQTSPTPTPYPKTFLGLSSCYSILTYKIVDICLGVVTLDRNVPDYSYVASECSYSRVLVYPPNMTSLYDSVTPIQHWSEDVINFESVCNTDEFDVKVWNMNIPWSENPAGFFAGVNFGYEYFGSASYLGTKEYLGYMTSSGQTFTNNTGGTEDSVFYYDSFTNKIIVTPEEQKAIAIIHYTNQTIDFFYGEKFAFEPYDSANPEDTTGEAVNFKLHLPWLMWHKNPECCYGETFYVDPPDFLEDIPKLLLPHYIKSTKNSDMNTPGIRYYYLWDNHPNLNEVPNRVGKVFPDQKIVIIDDEELIAALSYKSNRNWTLPAATTSLITPNTCGSDSATNDGVLSGSNETMFVTYLLGDSNGYSLHCNYYSSIVGPNLDCNNSSSQDVGVRFGGEFNCLTQRTQGVLQDGYFADTFIILCQKVTTGERPDSNEWRYIDFTAQLRSSSAGITQSEITGNTFVITSGLYDYAGAFPRYDLNNYIYLNPTQSGETLNFGDEYYFYGSLETDIQATIYEMRYKINLGQSEFQSTSNPSWTQGTKSYVSEIGLYDDEMNLMLISKLQSPVVRQGLQQFLIKFDF